MIVRKPQSDGIVEKTVKRIKSRKKLDAVSKTGRIHVENLILIFVLLLVGIAYMASLPIFR
jgi:uncharacterized membrane protein